jgi:hypothetical protein
MIIFHHMESSKRSGLKGSEASMGIDEEFRMLQNREHFASHQRAVGLRMMVRSGPALIGLVLTVLVVSVAGAAFYMWGWYVWATKGEDACDVPLGAWLEVLLCLPVATLIVNMTLHCCLDTIEPPHRVDGAPVHMSAEEECAVYSTRALTTVTNIIWFATMMTGAWFFWCSRTCHATNPALFVYVEEYITFMVWIWVVQFSLLFGIVKLVFWLRRSGYLTGEEFDGIAAREGLIDDIDDVTFDLVSVDDVCPECVICQEEFNDEKPMKKCVCGHIYHKGCLADWLGGFAKTCPLCKLNLEAAMMPHTDGARPSFGELLARSTEVTPPSPDMAVTAPSH